MWMPISWIIDGMNVPVWPAAAVAVSKSKVSGVKAPAVSAVPVEFE